MENSNLKILPGIFIAIGIAVCLASCTPVQPWQKGNLAKSYMSFDPDPLESKAKQHVYFSKEGSSGGYGVGGGGCGCN